MHTKPPTAITLQNLQSFPLCGSALAKKQEKQSVPSVRSIVSGSKTNSWWVPMAKFIPAQSTMPGGSNTSTEAVAVAAMLFFRTTVDFQTKNVNL